jgi:hypothetical protein
MASKEHLNSLFTYDETSPSCLRGKPSTRNKLGLPRGSLFNPCPYWRVKVGKTSLVAHRVIWEMHHGEITENMQIDHIDGDYLNNRLENLRMVTVSVNCRNRSIRKDNTTGVQGISSSYNNLGNRYFTVQWTDNLGSILRKRFSCTKLGEDAALSCAIEFHKNNREVLLDEGYTERHLNVREYG